MTSLLSPLFSFLFLSLSALISSLSFLRLNSPSSLLTNLSSLWLCSLFQSPLSFSLVLCAVSSHPFARFMGSRSTSKLHRSLTHCICFTPLPFSVCSCFLFFFQFNLYFLCCSLLSVLQPVCTRLFVTASEAIGAWLTPSSQKTQTER